MSYNCVQFKEIIVEVLKKYNLYSKAAVNLLLGTAAQESHFGTYLKQVGKGPALGVFQMEPATYDWMVQKFGKKYGFEHRKAIELKTDLELAILTARLRYYVVPAGLPLYDDLPNLALYWKKYYNTYYGAGKTEEFVKNYKKFVTCGE